MTGLFASTNQGGSMGVSEILTTIDQEIAQLQQARALLSGGSAPVAKKKVGRPRKADAAVIPASGKPAKKKKRNLSAEGRKRIAAAVKKRWAAQKAKAAAPKSTAAGTKKAAAVAAAKPAKKKRNLSPEGRKRIAEAAKKRWEAKKAAAAS
jgi:hypothetical protein